MNKNTPLISIITVCLNAPNLERTCESIVNQTFQDFEWLVIDGGSNDTTLAVFEKYKHRMNFFVSEKDNGIYEGMNKGIQQSTGVWLNFMNAGDCFATGGTLEKLHDALKNRLDMDVLYGEVVYDYPKERIISYTPDSNLLEFLFSNALRHQASFIKRTCFIKYGHYDVTLRFASDHKFFITLCKHGAQFLHLKSIVALFDVSDMVARDKNKYEYNKERKLVTQDLFSENERELFAKRNSPSKSAAIMLRNNILLKNSNHSATLKK